MVRNGNQAARVQRRGAAAAGVAAPGASATARRTPGRRTRRSPAGTLEGLARPALVACCKRLGVWTTGEAVAQMKEALGGAFELALAQYREAQQRGAAGAAALERLAAAAQATRDG